MIDKSELNFQKMGGLIPAIITDERTKQVLMLGFMNEDAFDKTIETKKVTFFSRSKKSLWTKGETSGNFLNLVNIRSDCDNDTLLISAIPDGPTCHTGAYSCFNLEKNTNQLSFLNELFSLIKERKILLPEKSYTAQLFKSGSSRIIQKVGEEAVETIIAAKNEDKNELVNEVSDLIYHLLVMLADQGIELNAIVENLEARHR
ncbi:MAG: bifunctional phosphoribosyl-AMP cyclohydrolase/phosphoribosyl-ATP diphosphatase HisIE [Melioribacteraceae bacterium]|nr:bifunctional phosphoribosyl-AMP cyclohydrolase/phosphoribosyl-ATP diphosphatase HisIE [Melioribacteraceae bacterium]